VSFSYYDFPVQSVEAAYAERETTMSSWGGSFEPLQSQENSIITPEGTKQYELRGYHTKTASSEKYLSGTQFGFIALNNGHIKIQGTCNTPEDLTLTLPIIAVVQLQK
jgi:hypothetical protein